MDIVLQKNGEVPIYDQIYRQIKQMILNRTLCEGDALPSMRLLAQQLRISVITTKRAYEELEREGLLVTMTGKGSFVAKVDRTRYQEEAKLEVERLLQKVILLCKAADLEKDDILRILQDYEEDF